MSRHELEQNLAHLRDVMPRVWWSIYQGSIQAGFDARQAFAVTQTYILANGSATVMPTSPPAGDQEAD